MKEYEWTPQEKREYDFISEWQDNHDCDPTYADAIAWADKHPNWIKADSDKQPDAGQLCVISPKTPGLYYLARWNERTHIFEILDSPCGYYRSALNYWMPIILPIEEDEE